MKKRVRQPAKSVKIISSALEITPDADLMVSATLHHGVLDGISDYLTSKAGAEFLQSALHGIFTGMGGQVYRREDVVGMPQPPPRKSPPGKTPAKGARS
jgi:hypothetical protein